KSWPVPFPTVESQMSLWESSNRRNNIALDGMSTWSRLTTSSRSKSVFGGDLYKPSPVGIHQLPSKSCKATCFQPHPRYTFGGIRRSLVSKVESSKRLTANRPFRVLTIRSPEGVSNIALTKGVSR